MLAPKLCGAYDAVPDAVFIIQPANLQILYVNTSAQYLTGLPPVVLKQKTLLDLHPEAVHTTIKAQLADLSPNTIASYEAPVRISPYTPHPTIDMRLQQITLDQQPFVIGIARDITARHAAEQALRESEILYRSLVEASFDLMFRITRDGIYRGYKVPASSGLPIPRHEDIIGKHVSNVVPKEVAKAVMPAIQRVVETGEVQTVEYQIEEPDGLRYYEARFVPSLSDEIVAVVRDITQQQREAEILRQSESTARALLDASSDAAVLLDHDWIVLAANETAAQAIDLPIQDMIGQTVFDLFMPQVARHRRTMTRNFMDKKGLLEFEDIHNGKNLFHRISPIVDEQNNIIQIAAFSRDITAQKQAHAKLLQQSAQLQCIAQATTCLLESGVLTDAVEQVLSLLGHTLGTRRFFVFQRHPHPEQVVNPATTLRYEWLAESATTSPFNPHAVNQQLINTMQRWLDVLSQGNIINGLVQDFPPSEQAVFAHSGIQSILAVPIFVDNEFWGLLGCDDNTKREWTPEETNTLQTLAASIGSAIKRHQTEDSLRQEREFADTLREVGNELTQLQTPEDIFRRLLELIRPIIPYDTASILLLVDDLTARVVVSIDHEQYELSTHDVMRVVFPVDQTPNLNTMMHTQQPVVFPDVRSNPAWVHRSEYPWIRSSLGAPIVWQGQVRGFFTLDSTQEGFYNQRHVDIIKPFAVQAAIALENAWHLDDIRHLKQIQSEMINIASHDLRGPLARIQIYAQRLSDELALTLTSKQQHDLDLVMAATYDMEHIITTILSQERIEAQHRSAQPIFWSEIIKQATTAAQNELKIHRHSLEVDCPPDLPVIRGNPTKLERAVFNLLQNAIKYTPSPGKIMVRAYVKPYGPRATIAVEVHDNGIGIPRDQQKQLFQRGYRAHQPGTEHIQGTGVGLSTVKMTIEEHRGHVYCDSTPGEGSVFGFRLPLQDEHTPG